MKATRGDTNNTLLLLQLSTRLLFSWTFSYFHGSTRLMLAILQNHTRSFKSLQSLEKALSKAELANCFILNDVGWVCETGNVLKDYKFPGMLGKMHACVVRLSKKEEESLGVRLPCGSTTI